MLKINDNIPNILYHTLKNFARIFYRNAINIGLPILECREAVAGISNGDSLDVDLEKGTIKNLTTGKEYKAKPFPPYIIELINDGGLVQHIKKINNK